MWGGALRFRPRTEDNLQHETVGYDFWGIIIVPASYCDALLLIRGLFHNLEDEEADDKIEYKKRERVEYEMRSHSDWNNYSN